MLKTSTVKLMNILVTMMEAFVHYSSLTSSLTSMRHLVTSTKMMSFIYHNRCSLKMLKFLLFVVPVSMDIIDDII